MEDNIAENLVKTGCYVNASKTNEKSIETPNGDKVVAYLSCRLAISNVKNREKIENNLVEIVKGKFSKDITIVGMATAGIPWAHAIAKELHLPFLYIRSSEKSYGLKGLIEGDMKYASKKAIIVDDVLYTGNTVNKARKVLQQNNIETVGVACIATLKDKIVEELEQDNIKVMNLTNYRNILKIALKNNVLSKAEYDIMLKIYKK